MVVNSRYNPFTYDELVKPLADYNTAYEKQEAALEKLATDAGAVEAFINEENAPKSWGVYTQFRDQLKNQADELATKGLSAKLRKDILNTGASYRSNVSPIVAAINRRQEAIKEFNNSPAGKSSNYIGQKPSDTSVDDWIGGNTPQIFGVNGNDVSDYVKAEVQAASERNYQLFQRSGYNVTKMGASQEETAALIRALRAGGVFDDSTPQGKYLNSILNDLRTNVITNAKTAFGFNNFLAFDANNNPIMTADANKFMDSVYHGIMSGMKGSEKQETNQYSLEKYRHDLRNQEAAFDAMLKSGQYTVGPDGKLIPATPQGEDLKQYRGQPFLFAGENAGLRGEVQEKLKDTDKPITYTDPLGNSYNISNSIDATLALNSIKEYKSRIAAELEEYGIAEDMISRFAKDNNYRSAIATSPDGRTKIEISRGPDGALQVRTKETRREFEPLVNTKPFVVDEDLTDFFNSVVEDYRNANNNERQLLESGVKDLALNKRETRKLMKDLGLPENTELGSDEFYRATYNIPNSDISQRAFIHLTVPGDDGKANREAINGEVSFAIHSLSGGDISGKNARGTNNVHKVNMVTGEPESSPIKKWDDAFTFNEKTGEVTNVLNYDLYPPAVARGNVIVTTTKGTFEIPIEFLGTTAASALKQGNVLDNGRILPSYQESIGSIMNSNYAAAEQSLYSLASVLAKGFGYNFFQRQGGTQKE